MSKELRPVINNLENNINKLPPNDVDFAKSLCNYYRKYTKLSGKQLHWVYKLLERVDQTVAELPPQKTINFYPELKNIHDMFVKAIRNGLKYPKVMIAEGISANHCGPNAKYPGNIYIRSSKYGGPYYGRIDKVGNWHPAHVLKDHTVLEKLIAFGKDPAHAAKVYGMQTNNCCFCRRKLVKKESVVAGYGPICADKFGLPWG